LTHLLLQQLLRQQQQLQHRMLSMAMQPQVAAVGAALAVQRSAEDGVLMSLQLTR
jgi:hypothetical protein